MGAIVPIRTIGSTLLGAAGAIQQGQAQASAQRAAAQADQYKAQVAEMNAQLAERQAQDAINRGQLAEQQQRQKAAQILGAQTAAMAANGVDLSFGSPLDVLTGTAQQSELDALTIRSNAAREAYDDRVKAYNYRTGGQLDTMRAASDSAAASAASTSGFLSAGGTILTGAGKAYQQYKYPIGAIG